MYLYTGNSPSVLEVIWIQTLDMDQICLGRGLQSLSALSEIAE